MESVRAGGSPVLRFYDWEPACLTIGYFQEFAVVDASECRRQGIEIVRRLTGGNAILHRECVTYAVIVGTGVELVAGGVVASQRRLSEPFAGALREMGAPVAAAPESARPAKGFDCFAEPGPWELTLEGRKVLGSAQTRRRGVVLQHGSLMLAGSSGSIAFAAGGNGAESVYTCTSTLRDYLPEGGEGLRRRRRRSGRRRWRGRSTRRRAGPGSARGGRSSARRPGPDHRRGGSRFRQGRPRRQGPRFRRSQSRKRWGRRRA